MRINVHGVVLFGRVISVFTKGARQSMRCNKTRAGRKKNEDNHEDERESEDQEASAPCRRQSELSDGAIT